MVTTTVAVKPGNVIRASVTYSSATNKFTVTIKNINTGATRSATQSVAGAQRSSAEWIVERPSLCSAFSCVLSTLANFGTSYFGYDKTGVSGTSYATINGVNHPISSFTDAAITMVGSGSGPILAKPSPLTSDGMSFTDAYV